MKVSPETNKCIIEAITDEVKDLLEKHWDGIVDCVSETAGMALSIPASIKLDFGSVPMTTKTTISYAVKTQDSMEDQIEDPDQLKMEPVDEEAKKAGRPKRENKGKGVKTE